jgi:hypothetical protein
MKHKGGYQTLKINSQLSSVIQTLSYLAGWIYSPSLVSENLWRRSILKYLFTFLASMMVVFSLAQPGLVLAKEQTRAKSRLVTAAAGTPISLDAKSAVSVPLSAGQIVNVTANGTWNYSQTSSCDADGDVTWAANDPNPTPLASQAAPAGAMIGIFVPSSYASYIAAPATDPNNPLNEDVIKRLMPRSILMGKHWRGSAPYDGSLIILMNDAPGGYGDDSGNMNVSVTAI